MEARIPASVTLAQLRGAADLLVDARLVGSPDEALRELSAYQAADPGFVLLVEADMDVIAVGVGSFDGYRGHIRRVAVAEDWRRVGFGSWVARELERRLVERGAQLLRVHAAGLAARWFWERLGYTTIEVSYLGKEPRRARTERTGESTPDALSWSRAGYEISTDRARLDLDVVHGFLRASYWATAIPRRVMERSIENSLCFGLYDQAGRQCGFARVVTDRATAAVLCDVFVLSGHRRRGLGVWLVECALTHPELEGIRRWSLVPRMLTGCTGALGSGRRSARWTT